MKHALNMVRSGAIGTVLAGVIVISTPSGQSNIVFTNGAASHTTSNYSAQVNDVFAGPGEHVTSTPSGTKTSQSNGKTATVTVVTK
jgi:hypothetical protein